MKHSSFRKNLKANTTYLSHGTVVSVHKRPLFNFQLKCWEIHTQKYEWFLSCLLMSKTAKLTGELHRSSRRFFFRFTHFCCNCFSLRSDKYLPQKRIETIMQSVRYLCYVIIEL
jgi:hypothetical protein